MRPSEHRIDASSSTMATQNSWAVERDVAACSDDNTRNLHTNTTGLGRNFPFALDATIGLWAKGGGRGESTVQWAGRRGRPNLDHADDSSRPPHGKQPRPFR